MIRRSDRSYAVLLLIGVLAACKCQPPPPVPPASLTEIVASPFDDLLEPREGLQTAIKGFLGRNHETTSKAGLAESWNAVDVLAQGFKLERIYEEARRDGSWAKRATDAGFDPDDVPDSVFVAGVRRGLTAWLEDQQ